MTWVTEAVAAFRIGLASARANLVPMAVLWLFSVSLVIGYYCVPGFAELLEPLARWQREDGMWAAFLNRVVFCGLLQGAFILAVKDIRPDRPYAVFVAQALWAGICGLANHWMFSLNARWFGTGIDFGTLCIKTAVSQFAWTPLFFIPAGTAAYFWFGHGLSFARTRREWPRAFFRELLLPNLIVNWCVWIPAVMLIHMFPTVLQIRLSGLVGVFHGLVMLKLGRK